MEMFNLDQKVRLRCIYQQVILPNTHGNNKQPIRRLVVVLLDWRYSVLAVLNLTKRAPDFPNNFLRYL